ncbi:MAG: tRNA threonylcarbamoyladenosine biosynthesis protein TsaE [Flavobacteriales bacterium]|jgi:tRNA threonylcarbamoyladenosine biosynthesis protein TsaE
MKTKVFESVGLDALSEVADFLLNNCQSRILAMFGAMGMGKTTFSKVLCKRLKVIDDISSPTFSLVNDYLTSTGESVYHFDFYRIDNPQEALDMGCEEYFYSGDYCIIEWPEKIEGLLPEDCTIVKITGDTELTRRIEISYI